MELILIAHAAAVLAAAAAFVLIRRRRSQRIPEEVKAIRAWAESSINYEKAFSNAIIDSMPGIFYIYDYPGLHLVYWNKNHETDFGFSPEEIRGKSLFDWHAPEVRDAVRQAVDRAMTTGSNAIVGYLRTKDERYIPYLLTGKSFISEDREYLMGVGINITEQKKAEEERNTLNAELETRVEERTKQLEEAMRNLKETQEQTVLSEKMADLGRLVAGLAHELNTPLGAILSAGETSSMAASQTGDVFDFYRGLDESGASTFRTLIASLRKPKDVIGGLEDRLLRKEYQKALAEAGTSSPMLLAEQLVEASFSGSAEDVRKMAENPDFPRIVEAIYKLSSIVRSNMVIGSAAEKAAKVISALKTYSRHDYGDTKTTADVREQLDLVLTINQNRIKGAVDVIRDYQDVPPVLCYPDRLDQVWMNLIGNAIQAMDYKGRLELRVEPEGHDVLVSIIDDGPGIPDAIREKIFIPFFTTKKPGEGTGLGLDICKRHLDQIGGMIGFESVPGRTCFTVRLHAAPSGEQL